MNPTDVIILGAAGLILAVISYKIGYGSGTYWAGVAWRSHLRDINKPLTEARNRIRELEGQIGELTDKLERSEASKEREIAQLKAEHDLAIQALGTSQTIEMWGGPVKKPLEPKITESETIIKEPSQGAASEEPPDTQAPRAAAKEALADSLPKASTHERVLTMLKGGPLGWSELRDKLGVSKSTLHGALKKLEKGGLVRKDPESGAYVRGSA